MEVQGEGMSDNNITPNVNSEPGYANAGYTHPGPEQGNRGGAGSVESFAPASTDAAPRVMRSASSSVFPGASAGAAAASVLLPRENLRLPLARPGPHIPTHLES